MFQGKINSLLFLGIFGISFFIILLYSLANQYAYFLIEHKNIIYILTTIIVIYSIHFTLSIYRNFNRKLKALFIIVPHLLILVTLTSYFLERVTDSENIFETSVLSLNSKLPMMIDENTRLEKVRIENNNIIYFYKKPYIYLRNVNVDFFTLMMADQIFRMSDIDKIILGLSKKKSIISYVFLDRNGDFIQSQEYLERG